MLWWGSSEKLSRCYLWDQLLVGGECWCYTVNSNTYAYLPFKSDMLDHWPNNLQVTQSTLWSTQYNWYIETHWLKIPNNVWQTFTIMARAKVDANSDWQLFMNYNWNYPYSWWDLVLNLNMNTKQKWYYRIEYLSWWYSWKWKQSYQYSNYSDWHHRAVVTTPSSWTIYIDWNLAVQSTWISWWRQWITTLWIWMSANDTQWLSNPMKISEVIYETWNISQTDIQKYVNCSKWNYWY